MKFVLKITETSEPQRQSLQVSDYIPVLKKEILISTHRTMATMMTTTMATTEIIMEIMETITVDLNMNTYMAAGN